MMVNAALAAQPSLIAKNTSQIRAKYELNCNKNATVGTDRKVLRRLMNTDHSMRFDAPLIDRA